MKIGFVVIGQWIDCDKDGDDDQDKLLFTSFEGNENTGDPPLANAMLGMIADGKSRS